LWAYFQAAHNQWPSKGASGSMRLGTKKQALKVQQHTLHMKKKYRNA